MNDAISTIALGVDTKSGKEHINELVVAFSALRAEMAAVNQLRMNPSVAGGASESKSALATLTAEIKQSAQQQVDIARKTATEVGDAVRNKNKIVAESEKALAAETQKLARETTKIVQEENAKRYSLGQSAKVGGVSYSMKGASNEAELTAALAKAEATRREILSTSQNMLIAEVERAEARRRDVSITAQAMLIADTERAEAARREKLTASQQLIIAEVERSELKRREKLDNSQQMVMAEADRAEAVRREKQATSQAMQIAEIERGEARKREITKAALDMQIAEIDRAEAKKLEAIRAARTMQMADIDRAEATAAEKRKAAQDIKIAEIERAEARAKEVRANSNTILMADADRAEERRLEKLKVSNEMMIAETLRAEERRQLILNNNFASAPLSSQVRTTTHASNLVNTNGGDTRLARELYGSAAVDATGRLNSMQAALNGTMANGNGIKTEAALRAKVYADSLNDAHSAARGLAGGLGQLWMTWGSIVPLLAGAAVTGSIAKIYEVGSTVEYQLQFLKALSNDMTREPINIDSFLKITDGTMSSLKDAAGGMRALAQAGMDQKQALRALPDVLNLAVIGEMSVGQAALAATGVVNAFGLSLNEIGRVGDVFAKVAASSNTSVQGMADSMKQASTVGEMFNVTLEEAAASIGVMAQRNIIGTAAGTALTTALKNLYEPTDKARAMMEQLNITTNDGHGGLKSYTQLVGELGNALSTLSQADQAIALGTMTEQRGQKALSAVINNRKGYDEFIKAGIKANGFMSEATLQLEDTVTGSVQRMKNTMEGTFVNAFKNAEPAVRGVVDEMTKLARSEGLEDTLSRIAIAAARLTATMVDNAGVIGSVVLAYIGLRVVTTISNSYVAWRTSTALATLTLEANTAAAAANTVALTIEQRAAMAAGAGMTTLATGTRLAAAAFGPITLLVMGAVTAYELLSANTDKAAQSQQRVMNTAGTMIEYYTREIAKLKEMNFEIDRKNQLEGKGAEKTVNSQIENKVNFAEFDVKVKKDKYDKALKAAGPSQSTFSSPMGIGVSTGNDPLVQAEAEYNMSVRKRDSMLNELELVKKLQGEHKTEFDLLKVNNDRDGVRSKVQDLYANAGGGLYKEGTKESRTLLPEIKELLDSIDDSKDAYLKAAPKIKELQDRVNEAKNPLKKNIDPHGNLAYRAQQSEYNGGIKGIKEQEKSDLDEVKTKVATKEISELQGVARVLEIVKKAREDELVIIEKKENLAASNEKRKPDLQLIRNKESENKFATGEADREADRNRREIEAKWEADSIQSEARVLTEKGRLREAFELEFKAKHGAEQEALEKSLSDPKLSSSDRTATTKRKTYLEKESTAGSKGAQFTEIGNEFDTMVAKMDEDLAKVAQKASETTGFFSDVGAAQMADDIRSKAIPAAQDLLTKMAAIAKETGNDKMKSSVSKMSADLIKEAGRSSKAWADAGKSIEKALGDAFGKGGKAVGGLIAALMKQKAQQKENDDQLKQNSQGKSEVEIAEMTKKAQNESAQNALSTYGDMAGAAKGFFDEHSKGYKVMQTAEQVFRAFEMASSLSAFLMKSGFTTAFTALFATSKATETGLHAATLAPTVAVETAKQGVYGITGLAAALSLPFPANIPAFAIVAAMLASIGVAVASGGSTATPPDISKERKKFNGTGLAYNSANGGKDNPYDWELQKSESVTKSLESMRDTANIALRYSSGQLMMLESINAGISGMASTILRSTGLRGTKADENALGVGSSKSFLGFNKDSTELKDSGIAFDNASIGSIMNRGVSARSYADVETKSSSWWGLSSSTNNSTKFGALDQDLNQQMNLTIKGMYDSILSAASYLGQNKDALETMLKGVTLKSAGLDRISLKGLSSDEVVKELDAAFGALGDTMARQALPGLQDFEKAGEGAMATLVRVSGAVDAAEFSLQRLGMKAIDYSKIANKQGDVTTEIVRDTILASEALKSVGKGVSDMVGNFTGSASDLTETYIKLNTIRSTMSATGMGNNVTQSMVRGAGGLDELSTGMASFLDNFLKDGEKAAVKASLLEQEFSKLNKTMPASKDQFATMVQGIDRSTEAGQTLYGALINLSQQFSDLADDSGAVSPALLSQRTAVKELTDTASKWLDTAKNARSLVNDLNSELDKAQGTNLYSQNRISELRSLMSSGTADYDQQLELAGEMKDLILERYQVDKDNAESMLTFGRDMSKYVKDLKTGDLSPLTTRNKLSEADNQYNATLTNLGSSDKAVRELAQSEIQGKADKLLELARTYYSSSSDYVSIFDKVTTTLDGLGVSATKDGMSMEGIANQQLVQLTDLRDTIKSISTSSDTNYGIVEAKLGQQLTVLEGMYEKLGLISEVPKILQSLPAEVAAAMGSYGVKDVQGLDAAAIAAYVAKLQGSYVLDANNISRTDPANVPAVDAEKVAMAAQIQLLVGTIEKMTDATKQGTVQVVQAMYDATSEAAEATVDGYGQVINKSTLKYTNAYL